jgi:hypothetical protein
MTSILANINTTISPHARAWVVDLQGTTTDHGMMCFEVPFATLRMRPLPHSGQTPESATTKLKTPLSAADSLLLRTHIAESQGKAYAALNAETAKYVLEDVRPHWDALTATYADQPTPLLTLSGLPARQVVDRLGAQITQLLTLSDKTAQMCCPTTTAASPSKKYFYPRAIARK